MKQGRPPALRRESNGCAQAFLEPESCGYEHASRLLPPWAVGNEIRELYDGVIYRCDPDEQHDEEEAPKQEWLFKPQQIRAAAAPKLSYDSAMYAEYDKCRSGDDTYESGEQCRSSGLSYEHECRLTTKFSDRMPAHQHAGARR